METSWPAPPVTGIGCHVAPASLLTRTSVPTAMQVVVFGHAGYRESRHLAGDARRVPGHAAVLGYLDNGFIP